MREDTPTLRVIQGGKQSGESPKEPILTLTLGISHQNLPQGFTVEITGTPPDVTTFLSLFVQQYSTVLSTAAWDELLLGTGTAKMLKFTLENGQIFMSGW
jgi:hypothetical protein